MSIVDKKFQPVLGQICWNVHKGFGSFLTFEFGEPHIITREPRKIRESRPQEAKDHFARRLVTLRGDWHLWIYMCNWVAYDKENLIGEAELSDEAINLVADRFDGQKLVRVSIEEVCTTIFEFDLGGKLVTFPWEESDEPEEQWKLFEPSGYVLALRSDGKYIYHHKKSTESLPRFL